MTLELLLQLAFESNVANFMRESNRIEGELEGHGTLQGKLYPDDVRVALRFLNSKTITEGRVLNLHAGLSKPKLDEGLMKFSWCGRYRDFDVRVGKYIAPGFAKVPELMKDFVRRLPGLNAWQAHNEFQKIHPFVDLNGRVGRLIWLWKKIREEGFQFGLPFLQVYYYDTLNHFENPNYEANEKYNGKGRTPAAPSHGEGFESRAGGKEKKAKT